MNFSPMPLFSQSLKHKMSARRIRSILLTAISFVACFSSVRLDAASYSNCISSDWVVPCPWNPSLNVSGKSQYCVYRTGTTSSGSGSAGESEGYDRTLLGSAGSFGSGGASGGWTYAPKSTDPEVCAPPNPEEPPPCPEPKVLPSKGDCVSCEKPNNEQVVEAGSYVNLWGLQYFDSYQDLEFAVPGGWLGVTRTYSQGNWRMSGTNYLEPLPADSSGRARIDMSGRTFTETSANFFVSEDLILEATPGATWEDSYLKLTEPDGKWSLYRGTAEQGALLYQTGHHEVAYLIYDYDWAQYPATPIDQLRLLAVSSAMELEDGLPKVLLEYQYAVGDFTKDGAAYPLLTSIAAPSHGLIVSYEYYDGVDESGLLKTVYKSDGTRSEYTYDSDDNLKTKTEYDSWSAGTVVKAISIEYHTTKQTRADAVETRFMLGALAGPSKRVASVTNAAGVTKTFSGAYNESSGGYYSQVDYSDGKSEEYWYDDAGELIQRSVNGQTTYNRSRVGRIERITTRGNSLTILEYDEFDNLIRETSPSGYVSSRSYTGELDRIASRTNEVGVRTAYTYDDDLSDNVMALDQKIKAAPFDAVRSVQITETSADAALTRTRAEYYDIQDRLILEVDPLGHQTAYTYLDQTTLIESAYRLDVDDGNGGDFVLYSQTYDTMGNRQSRTDANGQTTTYEYDSAGRLLRMTNANGVSTLYTYQGNDLVELETGRIGSPGDLDYQPGRRTRYTYDGAGNRTAEYRVDASDSSEYRYMSYTYDTQGQLVQTTDADGLVTLYEYDIYGNQVATKLPIPAANALGAGAPEYSSTTRVFNVFGDLLSETDPSGRTTTFTYDKEGRILSATEAEGTADARGVRYRYDGLGQIIETIYSLSDGSSESSYTEFDAFGRVLSVHGYGVYEKTYTYDANDNLLTVTDARGLVTRSEYDAFDRAEAIYNDEVLINTRQFDASGNLVQTTDGEGIHTSYHYDALHRLTHQSIPLLSGESLPASWWTDFDQVAQERSYNRFNEVASERAALGELTTNTYDDYGRLATVTIPAGATITYTYTPADRIRRIRYPAVSTSAQTQASELVLTYDSAHPGLPVAEQARSGEVTSYAYDAALRRSKVVTALGSVRAYTYDLFGRIDQEIDYASPADYTADSPYRTTEYTEYDDFDRLLSVSLPAGEGVQNMVYDDKGQLLTRSGANTYPVDYSYDATGRLETMTTYYGAADQAGSTAAVTTWEYDLRGRLTRKIYDDDSDVSYTYLANDRLATRTGGREQLTSYSYDAWGNLDTIDYPDPDIDVTFSYLKNRRLTMADASGTTTWSYHAASGLPLSESKVPVVGETSTIEWAYDGEGRRIQMTVDGLSQAVQTEPWETYYYYDRYGRLERLHDTRAAAQDAFRYRYQSTTGLLETVETPWQQSGQSGVLRHSMSYDAYGRLIARRLLASDGSVLMAAQNIQYDALNRRTDLNLQGGTLYASPQARAYSYDAYGQLAQQSTDSQVDEAFEYDPIGNRLNAWQGDPVDPETLLSVYSPDSLNQYTQIQTDTATTVPLHDTDGNLSGNDSWTYTWDAENRLIQATAADGLTELRFIYDGFGRRAFKEVYTRETTSNSWLLTSNFQYIYDGWNLIVELEYNSSFVILNSKFYIWGPDVSGRLQGAGGVGGLLAVTDESGSTYVPAYDFNGNVMGYYDPTNETSVAEYAYSSFGQTTASAGTKADDFSLRFSTKYQDTETSLYYYGYRYYNAETGRWLSRDPIQEQGGLNLYGFVDNDGVNYWDYLGREKAGGSYVVVNTDSSGNNPLHNNATGRFESRQNLINQVNGSDGPGKGFDVNTGPKVPNPGFEITKKVTSQVTGIPLSPEDIATLPYEFYLNSGGKAAADAVKNISLCETLRWQYSMHGKKAWTSNTFSNDNFSLGIGNDLGEKSLHYYRVVKDDLGSGCEKEYIVAWHFGPVGFFQRHGYNKNASYNQELKIDLSLGACSANRD